MKVNYIDIPKGERIAYRQAGSGDPLVIIHGNQSSSIFVEPIIEDFKDDYEVFAPDMAGFGDSSYKTDHEEISDWAQDIIEFIEALGLEKVVLMGWSLGGAVAIKLATMRDDLLEKLVIMASSSVKGFPMFETVNGVVNIHKPIYKREDVIKDPNLIIPVSQALKNQDLNFFKTVWSLTIYNKNKPDEERFDQLMKETLKERCFVDCSVALIQMNVTNEKSVVEGDGTIDNIKTPVYWIHGRDDLVVNLDVAKDSKDYFKNFQKLYIIDDAGHSAFTDQREEFNQILEEILEA